ncbi:MAG TPA: hypothetical protein VHO24_17760 [Opitutaceae bacterium]|nr:hypothetical protein [Opitutaceae bacterium]
MKTKNHVRLTSRTSERGSAIIVVMMICLAMLLLVGSFLRTMSVQSRTGYRAILGTEARSAAEAAVEYAMGEMHRRAAADPSFGVSGSPLSSYSFSSSDLAFLAPGTGNNHVVSAQLAFKGGVLSNSPSSPSLIDETDAVYELDAEKGKSLVVRSMNIFGKAQVNDPNSARPITSYVAANVQIREQSWFNYAVFYNMDMEFHSATTMDIFGPVHSNANIYAAAGNSNFLNFYSTLTTPKKILRQAKYYGGASSSHTGTVRCITKSGMLAADLSAMGTTEDSTNPSFRTAAQAEWKGYVMDETFKVNVFNPPGLPAYVPENFSTGAIEMRNGGYVMIEPQLSRVAADADTGHKGTDSENLKFAAKSGFVIRVSAPAVVGGQPTWKLVVYQAADSARWLSADNLPVRDVATGKPVELAVIDPFNDIDAGPANDGVASRGPGGTVIAGTTAAATWKIKRALKTALLDAIVTVPYGDAGTTGALWGNGTSNLKKFNQVAPATTTIDYYPIYDRREGYIYPGGATSTADGLKGAMHVLQIDLGKLNTLLRDTATGGTLWQRPGALPQPWVYAVDASYSGVVYVQFPLAPVDTTRFPAPVGATASGDMIRPAVRPIKAGGAVPAGAPGFALKLVNCATLPQLPGGGSTSPDGFTIATNGPAYIVGNYNSDGNSATGSEILPDSAAEVPALIAADSVTILSSGFSVADNIAMATTKTSASAFTEVSAAIVTGLVPTQPGVNDIWAGGVHNFIRFHEDWGSATYRYRGSIAALFESEVAKSPWRQTYYTYWYTPPTRDVGYHQYLARGRFPPATPIKRTVRRMSMFDISAATYATGPTQPPPAN